MSYKIPLEKFELANKIPVYISKKLGAPMYILITIKGGNAFIEDSRKKGLPHCVEHLLVSASPQYPTKDILASFFDSFGAIVGAYTNLDTVNIHATIPESLDLEPILSQVMSCLLKPEFQVGRLEHEKEIILAEISRGYSKVDIALSRKYLSTVFLGTKYEADILGTPEDVKSFTPKDVIWWNNKFVNSSNISLTVVGDFEESSLFNTLEKYMGKISSGDTIEISTLEPSKFIPVSYLEMSLDQVQIKTGFRLPDNLSTKQKVSLYLISTILGKARSGILSRVFREQLKLVYTIYCRTGSNFFGSEFNVSTGVIADKVNIFDSELKKLFLNLSKYISNDEFALEKKRLKKIRSLRTQTSEEVADLIVQSQKFDLSVDEFWNHIDNLNYDDILSAFVVFEEAKWVLVRTR